MRLTTDGSKIKNQSMKKIIYMTLALISIAIMGTGCKKDKIQTDVIGEWHCVAGECDIYLGFSQDNTFELYQKLGEGRYYLYKGAWSADKDIISGQYNDGTPWGSSYQVTMKGPDNMTMTATNGSGEVNTYTREAIPEKVKDEHLVAVKSMEIPAPTL